MRNLTMFLTTLFLFSACTDQSEGSPSRDPESNGETEVPDNLLTSCYQGDAWNCAVEAEIVLQVNALRGANPLVQHFESSFVARTRSNTQATQSRLSHAGFPEEQQLLLTNEFPNLHFVYRAENVAMSTLPSEDPAQVAERLVSNWESSAGHRANMLGSYRFIGVGVVRKGNQVYATQIFYN